MYLSDISQLNPDRIRRFYTPSHPGFFVIRDKTLARKVLRAFQDTRRLSFEPKDHPEINLGQASCDTTSKALLKIYSEIRNKFPKNKSATETESGFTRYPASSQGSAFHVDFSRNQICTVTFFAGHTLFYVADTKQGANLREFIITPGSIVIMRAPRNDSPTEKKLRPIHAVGLVPNEMYAYEVREVAK